MITHQLRTWAWGWERGSVSGKTEVLTEYIQWLWFKWVQRNWWKVAQAPERPQAELCEKPCGLPMVSCQALTLFGFLWVSFPCEFCLEAESFSGALNSKPNSAPSNHFPLVCFSASFVAFPQGQTHRLTWTGPKDSWPQLIALKTQDYERGVPKLCGLTGKKSPSSLWLSPCSPLFQFCMRAGSESEPHWWPAKMPDGLSVAWDSCCFPGSLFTSQGATSKE